MMDGGWKMAEIYNLRVYYWPAPYTFGRHLSIVDELGKLKHVQKV